MPEILDSEFAFIARLERHFPRSHPALLKGRGDDCALLAWPERTLISTDLFIEDVHFRRSYFTPEQIGHKALAVNLSDIAGMGGAPLGFCLGLMLPGIGRDASSSVDADFWDRLMAGMATLAGRWNVPLVGGDCSRAPCLGLSITVWGESVRPVYRGQCSPGDVLFACGPARYPGLPVGLARAGFLALEELGAAACDRFPAATAAHLQPEPMLDPAPALASHSGVNSLMDLSDGLATDLPRLLGAETAPHEGRRATPGAALELDPHGLHPELLELCLQQGRDPVREAVLGGEDYCLIGACSEQAARELAAGLPGFARIGSVTAMPDLTCNGHDLADFAGPGFDHFRKGDQA